MSTKTTSSTLDLRTVKTWAKGQAKQLTALRKGLERAEDVSVVLKNVDISDPGMRTMRNRGRKLLREFPTPARSRSKLLREVDLEIRRFEKILALL
jgi:hypothetical protein